MQFRPPTLTVCTIIPYLCPRNIWVAIEKSSPCSYLFYPLWHVSTCFEEGKKVVKKTCIANTAIDRTNVERGWQIFPLHPISRVYRCIFLCFLRKYIFISIRLFAVTNLFQHSAQRSLYPRKFVCHRSFVWCAIRLIQTHNHAPCVLSVTREFRQLHVKIHTIKVVLSCLFLKYI